VKEAEVAAVEQDVLKTTALAVSEDAFDRATIAATATTAKLLNVESYAARRRVSLRCLPWAGVIRRLVSAACLPR
jgi:hypothetical protein